MPGGGGKAGICGAPIPPNDCPLNRPVLSASWAMNAKALFKSSAAAPASTHAPESIFWTRLKARAWSRPWACSDVPSNAIGGTTVGTAVDSICIATAYSDSAAARRSGNSAWTLDPAPVFAN